LRVNSLWIKHPGMPQSARSIADFVLPPAAIARELGRIGGHLCLPLIRPIGSRRTPAIFVMESTHAWHLHHPALARRLRTPRLGRIFGQR
jgi:hypothetical protein